MSVRIGINGFGRMGRLALRVAWGVEEIEVAHINELNADAHCSAHLLKFDSVHGRWSHDVSTYNNAILIEDTRITHSSWPSPAEVDWNGRSVELVIEASGQYRDPQTLQSYFDHGVRKVVVAAPVKRGALNIVMGVNDHLYQSARHHLITAASCTTNCLAPVVKVMHEEIGIRHGTMTTIHDITNTQTPAAFPCLRFVAHSHIDRFCQGDYRYLS